jgi:hypothetical protein
MKMRNPKKEKESSDPFVFFKKAAVDAFGFLIRDYDFEHVSTTIEPPMCEIKLSSRTTGVTVSYEWGGVPWVVLARLNVGPEGEVEAERYGLHILLEERCPDRAVEYSLKHREYRDSDIETMLNHYARLLREFGEDILNGDFEVFSKLKSLAERSLREENLRLYGSETGETP